MDEIPKGYAAEANRGDVLARSMSEEFAGKIIKRAAACKLSQPEVCRITLRVAADLVMASLLGTPPELRQSMLRYLAGMMEHSMGDLEAYEARNQ